MLKNLTKRKVINNLKAEMFRYTHYKYLIENDLIKSFRHYEYVTSIINFIEEALSILDDDDRNSDKVDILKEHYFKKPTKSLRSLALEHHYSYETLAAWELEFFRLLITLSGWSD